MKLNPSICLTLLTTFLVSCASAPKTEPTPPVIHLETRLPESFHPDSNKRPLPQTILVSDKAIGISRVSRRKAELREGPGIQFNLKDEVLIQDATVLVLDRVGKWVKITVPNSEIHGWVHSQTLEKLPRAGKEYLLQPEQLPKVFTVRPVKQAFQFKDETPLAVAIPKGMAFLKLLEKKDKILVVVAATESLMWLSKKDAE